MTTSGPKMKDLGSHVSLPCRLPSAALRLSGIIAQRLYVSSYLPQHAECFAGSGSQVGACFAEEVEFFASLIPAQISCFGLHAASSLR